MNYAFSNLLGAPYRGGNLVIHNNQLLSPVGNRVSEVSSGRPYQLRGCRRHIRDAFRAATRRICLLRLPSPPN